MSSPSSSATTVQSPTQRFFLYFQLEATALQQQMARLENLPTIGGERMDAIDHCLGGISRLQKEVQDAASYTTAYDQRMYSEGIKALHEKLEDTRKALAPKTKFSFKSAKKNNSAISLSDAAELAMQQQAKLLGNESSQFFSEVSSMGATAGAVTPSKEPRTKAPEPLRRGSLGSFLKAVGVESTQHDDPPRSSIREMSFLSSNAVNISSHTGVHIILPSSAAHATSSGSLTDLRRCIIDMSVPTASGQPFAGLTIKDVKQSLLICGTVNGAAHITGVEASVILVRTRQFRMHECKDCVVYLHVSSKPIIEGCSGVRFAPLSEEHLHQTGSISSSNQWDQIQDFKWLKSEPSPNWSTLPAADTVPDQIWQAIARSGPEWTLESILKASGVSELTN